MPSPTPASDLDYEAFVAASKRRFTQTVGALIAALLQGLYVPWALVSAHVLSSTIAEVITCASAFLLLCAWQALLTKLSDPRDASVPTAEGRGKHLGSLLGVASAIIGAIVVVGIASWVVGWISSQGLFFSVAFSLMLGAMVGRALLWRAVRHGR
jgi:hypothetical protein